MFACSQGGHFSQMMALKELFGEYNSVLVTDNIQANKGMHALKEMKTIEYSKTMAERRKKYSEFDGNKKNKRLRFIVYYLKQFNECRKIYNKYKPAIIISTGSNIAVPLFIVGKLKGSKLIFIESRAKVYGKTVTGKLIGGISDQVFVQWPEMLKIYPKAKYCGTLV